MAKILIAAGVKPDETGSDDCHALPLSIVKGQTDFALFLLDQGANPNDDIDGIPALQAAAGAVDLWLGNWVRKHEGLSDYGGVFSGGLRLEVEIQYLSTLLAHLGEPNHPTPSCPLLRLWLRLART